MNHEYIIKQLKKLSNPKNVEGMARFGIKSKHKLGIRKPALRKLASQITKDPSLSNKTVRHRLAGQLWSSEILEARILASMIDVPELVTEKQMDYWITGFDSWDLCDQVCMNLLDKTPLAYRKAVEWSKREPEFEKRAGYALMACLAWHDKEAPDSKFIKFFPHIKLGATDERNFVKKAVNWALRQIGKRNKKLNGKAIKLAREIEKMDSKSARWIAKDALRELSSEPVQSRFN